MEVNGWPPAKGCVCVFLLESCLPLMGTAHPGKFPGNRCFHLKKTFPLSEKSQKGKQEPYKTIPPPCSVFQNLPEPSG